MLIGVIQSAQVADCGSFGVLRNLSEGVCRGIIGRLIISECYFCRGVCAGIGLRRQGLILRML